MKKKKRTAVINRQTKETEVKGSINLDGTGRASIKTNEPFTHIDWIYTVNGTDVPRKGIGFKFEDGSFANFGNGWDLYTVCSADLKVSRDDAIRIAREHAQSYSWKVGNTTVSDFTILDSPVNAESSMQPREDNTLYPWWNIQLYLDKVYPGMIGSIQVGLWADTGEITNIEAISAGGLPPEDHTEQTGLDLTPLIIAVPLVLAITLGAAIIYKRKNKNSHKRQ